MTNGYISISLSGGRFYAHRIAFLISNKYMPKYIDHINSIKTDNRLSNLRECTFSENSCNKGRQKRNTSGYKGVYWNKRAQKWISKINKNDKEFWLGTYNCKHEAARAYNRAAIIYHGEFAYLNEIKGLKE